jgi:hypothetical protein
VVGTELLRFRRSFWDNLNNRQKVNFELANR